MKSLIQALLVLVMIIVAGTAPRSADAATSVGASGVRSTTAIINDIINGAPGVTKRTTTGTGVTTASSSSVRIPAGRGVTVPIPVAAEAAVSAGRVAGIAARAIRWGSWAGIAAVVIPWAAEKSGIETCPPPDFFCKRQDEDETAPNGAYWQVQAPNNARFTGPNGQAVCTQMYDASGPVNQFAYGPLQFRYSTNSTVSGFCIGTKNQSAYGRAATLVGANGNLQCPDGYNLVGNKCVKPGGLLPVSEPVLGDAIEQGISGNPDRVKRTYDAVRNAGFPVFQPTDPVTVTVPPSVTGQPTTTTTTQAKPDGSIDTIKTTTQTEVKPQVSGTTIGNTTISYPTTTTTTTTTTNNVTNITYNTTTISNTYPRPDTAPDTGPDAPPKPETPLPETPDDKEEMEIPTDYNREVTQQSILAILKSWAEPVTEQLPDGQVEADAIQAKHDEGLSIVDGISAEGVGLTSWFPTVPTAACINPQIPNPVTGEAVSFPICGYVDTFSKFISGVICFFCVLGCVHQVQSAFRA